MFIRLVEQHISFACLIWYQHINIKNYKRPVLDNSQNVQLFIEQVLCSCVFDVLLCEPENYRQPKSSFYSVSILSGLRHLSLMNLGFAPHTVSSDLFKDIKLCKIKMTHTQASHKSPERVTSLCLLCLSGGGLIILSLPSPLNPRRDKGYLKSPNAVYFFLPTSLNVVYFFCYKNGEKDCCYRLTPHVIAW